MGRVQTTVLYLNLGLMCQIMIIYFRILQIEHCTEKECSR